METRIFKLDELNPAGYNPRKDLKPDDKQYQAIQNSIEQFGFVEPLVVNVHDGKNMIVGGHQRYKILKASGVSTTEAVVVDLDGQKEKALNIALNKIDGEWDNEKLQELFREFDEEDVTDIGFTEEEYEDLVKEYEDERQNVQESSQSGSEEADNGDDDKLPTEEKSGSKNGLNSVFEIYLSFPSKEAARKWLDVHEIKKEFDDTRNITIDLTEEPEEEDEE